MPSKPQFQNPDCELTLSQALEEFYAVNAHKFSKPTGDTKWSELMVAHDACHVMFGVNTSLVEEAYGDMWTLCGTTMKAREYAAFAKSDEAKALISDIGIWNTIKGSVQALPGAFRIFLRTRKMTKKWDVWNFQNRLSHRLVDLRKEHNLKILTT